MASRPKGGYTCAKLSEDDLELIEVLKVHSPSISLYEIMEEIEQLGGEHISMLAVSRAIENRLPSGQQYSRNSCESAPLLRKKETSLPPWVNYKIKDNKGHSKMAHNSYSSQTINIMCNFKRCTATISCAKCCGSSM